MSEPSAPVTPQGDRLCLTVPDMDCPSCLATISERLEKVSGVREVRGSPMRRELEILFDAGVAAPATLQDEVERLGYRTEQAPGSGAAGMGRISTQPLAASARDTWRGPQALIAYGSAVLFAAGGLLQLLGIAPGVATVGRRQLLLPDLVFVVSALVGGWNFFPKGLLAARARALDMNFLMTVAILGAVGIGEYVEGAAIAFLFAIAELLERYAVDRARASVDALMRLAPDVARLRRGDEEISVAVDELALGDVFVVRPGDRLPTDGTVVEGASAVDQSPVTGESVPVEKSVGSTVFAGTINREGFLAVRVDRPAADSTLARIIRMVEEAEARKTRTERFVERFARIYTPAVTVAAVLTVALPVLFLDGAFAVWFTRGLTLLVIACPCALVISTPVAVVSGVTAAARHGVLIKGGRYLEAFGQVRTIALDKTGTLTFGRPQVAEVRLGDGCEGEAARILAGITALEARSEHPVGRAAFAAPGQPVPEGWQHEPGSVAVAAEDGRVIAWFRLADRTRASAAAHLRELRGLGIERLVVLTGDAQAPAEAVGLELGVDDVRWGLLPEQKVEAVAELERVHGPVAMVGDGVNDAPALASAGVGVVMGAAGSDAALETADIALMGDDLSRLAYVRSLSQEAVRVIRTNIVLALGVKAILAVGVPLGAVSLITAVVVGDMGVSLAVTLNALRLARVGAEA